MTGKLSRLLSRAPRFNEDENQNISKWALFRQVFSKNKMKMLLLSVAAAFGAAFGIYLIFARSLRISELGAKLPFSGNLGIGFPVSLGTDKTAALEVLKFNFTFFTLLIPAIVIFSVFLSGAFYTVNRLTYTNEITNNNLMKSYWHGFKKCIVNFVVIAFLLAGVIWLGSYAVIGIKTLQINGNSNFFLVFLIILIYAVIILYSIMSLYMMSLTITYKMNILQLIKNSFLLTFSLLPRNLIFVILAFFPIGFAFIPGVSTLILMYFVILGIAVSILVFVVYSQWVFDRVGLDKPITEFEGQSATVENPYEQKTQKKIEGKEKVKDEHYIEDRGASNNKNKKKQNVYVNPKKKKK